MFQTFDIETYLNSRGVEPHFPGEKNVSQGWINIECPFCGDDPSWHLGINAESKFINCYRCGTKGSILPLVQKISACGLPEAYEVIKSFQTFAVYKPAVHIPTAQSLADPAGLLPDRDVSLAQKRYLEGRNFDPSVLREDFGVCGFSHLGDYKFRLYIPIFVNRQLVNYTTRAIHDKSYKSCPNKKAVIQLSDLLYNIDSVRAGQSVLICEGPTDVWRMGPGTVGTLGMHFGESRVALLRSKKLKKAFVMFDAEEKAEQRAEEVSTKLSVFIPHVEVIYLPEGDPAQISAREAHKMRRLFFA